MRKPDENLTTSTKEAATVAANFYGQLYSSRFGDFNFEQQGPLAKPITVEEIRQACDRIKGNTAPGVDGIPSRVTKYCAPLVSQNLVSELNRMFEHNSFPKELTHANTILLHKKGDSINVDNYRPISLLPTVYKTLTRVITQRLALEVNDKLPVEQVGFRPKFSTVDHIMTVNLLAEKCREWALPLHMVFIDFKKAFDSIELNSIWKALEYSNIDATTTRMIKQLFNWNNRGYRIGANFLHYLAFADDLVLVSEKVKNLQTMLEDLTVACSQIGLEINTKKTK